MTPNQKHLLTLCLIQKYFDFNILVFQGLHAYT